MKTEKKTLGLISQKNDETLLKLLSISENSPSQLVAEVYLYTKDETYFVKVKKKDLNKEMYWNQQTFALLKEAFLGNKKIFISFQEREKRLKFGIILQENSIKVLFFEKCMTNLEESPFTNMKQIFSKFRSQFNSILTHLYSIEDKEKKGIQQISSLKKYRKDLHESQINQMKDSFLPLINKMKGQIKELMKQYVQEVEERKVEKNKKDEKRQKSDGLQKGVERSELQCLF